MVGGLIPGLIVISVIAKMSDFLLIFFRKI